MPFATADQLKTAAEAFQAQGKPANAKTCTDMATRITRGLGLTEKANAYALDLIAKAAGDKPAPRAACPKLVGLFFGPKPLANLDFGQIVFSMKNDGTVVWIKHGEKLAGCVDLTGPKVFRSRINDEERAEVEALLAQIEHDPLGAAQEHGKRIGRCCVCSARLTDPKSIDAGIGPVCAKRLG